MDPRRKGIDMAERLMCTDCDGEGSIGCGDDNCGCLPLNGPCSGCGGTGISSLSPEEYQAERVAHKAATEDMLRKLGIRERTGEPMPPGNKWCNYHEGNTCPCAYNS